MANFTRIYGTPQGLQELTKIEGIVVIDQAPPAYVQGVPTGVVCVVGEFADMGVAVQVDSEGNVTPSKVPVAQVLSQLDLTNKFGGWDETLGNFGGNGGSGYLAVNGKAFGSLLIAPVNFCSSKAIRLWRQLPTNKSATSYLPIVPLQGVTEPAGLQFTYAGDRVRLGTAVTFQGTNAYTYGLDGAVTLTGVPAGTQLFTSAGAKFLTGVFTLPSGIQQTGVLKGDALVLGVIGGAAGLDSGNAATYRIVSVVSDTQLMIQQQAGLPFDWVTGTALPWRIHVALVADSGGNNQLSDLAGYTIPARPLDATIPAGFLLTPSTIPPFSTANSWDPSSGLQGGVTPGGALVYTADIQAPNAVGSPDIDALYQAAIDGTLSPNYPQSTINIMYSARSSNYIRSYLRTHVLAATGAGLPRMCIVEPALSVQDPSIVLGDAAPGVGAQRDERVIYTYCGVQQFFPAAVNYTIPTADGQTTTTGTLDTFFGAFYASLLSLLAPERNPGQSSDPVPTVFSNILGLQRGAPNTDVGTYVLFKQRGVSAIRVDADGAVIQSGITSSLNPAFLTVQRRRMADFIEISLAKALNPFCKEPATLALRVAMVDECQAFLDQLAQLPQQRIIAGYVDGSSGNTPESLAQGVVNLIVNVQLTPTADIIVITASIGNGVVVVSSSVSTSQSQ